MGNDGGSIPTRRELVKEAARNPTSSELKETRQEWQTYNWKNCPLSHKVLSLPIVSDYSGRLYNKEPILEYLIPSEDEVVNRNKEDSQIVLDGRVNALRDVVEVKFEVESSEKSEQNWICPITNKQLGPGVKAVYLVPCGHAFSEMAIKEVAVDSCPQCSIKFSKNDIISILPTSDSDVERLDSRIKLLRNQGLTHSLKKTSSNGKKRKNDAAAASSLSKGSKKARIFEGIKDPATAALATRVLDGEGGLAKRQELAMNENIKGLFSNSKSRKSSQATGDFMTRGFTIPKNARR